MNAEEAAKFLGIKARTVLVLAKRRKLAHHRIGRRVVFRAEDLRAYLDKTRVEARGEDAGRRASAPTYPDMFADIP